MFCFGGRALIRLEGSSTLSTLVKLRIPKHISMGRQTATDNGRSREG
jgi:hypothetical protein